MKLRTFQVVKLLFFIFASIAVLLTILAPIYQPSNAITNLSGSVGTSDNEDIISHIHFPWDYTYAFGDVWCHQKSERSFFIRGNQMPVCARCIGIFLGVFFGLGISIFTMVRIDENVHKKILKLFVVGYLLLAIDVTGQSVGLWHSINAIRVLSGSLAGTSFGFILGMAIDIVNAALLSSVLRNN